MTKLTVKRLGVTTSPTGESWLVRSSGGHAIPLTPNTPAATTNSCTTLAGDRVLPHLLSAKPGGPHPWLGVEEALRTLRAFLPVPWPEGEEPLVYVRGPFNSQEIEDLMALSCQNSRHALQPWHLSTWTDAQIKNRASQSNISPVVMLDASHIHQSFLSAFRFAAERRVAGIVMTTDNLLLVPRSPAVELQTAEEVRQALQTLKQTGRELTEFGAAALVYWAVATYEEHQFGIPPKLPWN